MSKLYYIIMNVFNDELLLNFKAKAIQSNSEFTKHVP